MNCIIIHGCPSNKEKALDAKTRTYDKHWMPWTKKQLELNGIKTEIPLMPEPWQPTYENFRQEFEKYDVNENTILIGHSCGTTFLVRWLGETNKKISKLILVGPWKISWKEASTSAKFSNYTIDPSIKSRVGKIMMFTSNNEREDGKKSLILFHEVLGGEIINLPNRGHYVLNDMGTEEFPELIEAVLK